MHMDLYYNLDLNMFGPNHQHVYFVATKIQLYHPKIYLRTVRTASVFLKNIIIGFKQQQQ